MPKKPDQGTHTFKVEGSGNFPFDMLRYDRCWPKGQDDVTTMNPFNDQHRMGKRYVWLVSNSEPTKDRWLSFGWQVTEHTPNQERPYPSDEGW